MGEAHEGAIAPHDFVAEPDDDPLTKSDIGGELLRSLNRTGLGR